MQRYLFALAMAFALTVTAEAHYWKLSGSPVYVDQVNESKGFYVGETRPSNAAEEGGTIQVVGRSFTSADFISISVRYGVHRVHYFWDAPPDIIRPGGKLVTRIGWSIAQKWNRFSPTSTGLAHLDWSDDFYIRNLRYGYGDADVDSNGFDKHAFTVTNNNNDELSYIVHVGCAEGWVRVKWTYRKVEGEPPAGVTTDDAGAGGSPASAGATTASTWHVPPGNTGTEALTAPPEPQVVHNGADGGVSPGATQPATFDIGTATLVTQIMTYHYGSRARPGTIALRHQDGTIYGPWQAAGAGSPSLANVYWWVRPNIVLKPGRYTVIDSDPATWSTEAATHGAGIFVIWGRKL